MAVIQNENGLIAISTRDTGIGSNPFLSFFENDGADVQTLYKTQPEVRACVDFLSRNIAQLPIKVYDRVSDTERRRVNDGPLVFTLDRPAPNVTRTRWVSEMVSDLAVYGNSYHVKVRSDDGRIALVRIPPKMVTVLGNWIRPDSYEVAGTSSKKIYKADQVLHIVHGYNPEDQRVGLSPLTTLRQVLAEQAAAGKYREQYWKNAARMSGVIERPAGSPAWSDAARSRFRAEWEATYTGANASGKTVVLEEGMAFKPVAFNARDSQYMESFQLTREIVATAYGIPIGLLGLGSFTYASLSEQHRQLYADCLAPWIVMIQEELEAQLLPEFGTTEGLYIEFDVDAKLQGSIEERARIFQSSVGGPYVTRNEARAKLNLSPVEGGDELIVPLNVITGGQASPQDSVPVERLLGAASSNEVETKAVEEIDEKAVSRAAFVRSYLRRRDRYVNELVDAVEKSLRRQQSAVTSKTGAKSSKGEKATAADVYDRRRFTRELTKDIRSVADAVADDFGSELADRFGNGFNVAGMNSYLEAVSSNVSDSVTKAISDELDDALSADDTATAIGEVFDRRIAGAALFGLSIVTTVANTARNDAAEFANAATKTWIVTSGNPRSSHAAISGQTVPFSQPFGNGLLYPGESGAPDDERANCSCVMDIS
jgi:HK97 family phage portal protein